MTKVLAEVTGSISFSQRGEKGEKGDNGVGVKGFNTFYGLSDYESHPPTAYNFDTLSKTIIETNKNKYVWSADKVLYTDGTGDDFINAYCIGKCSDLTSVREQYGTSTSAGTPPRDDNSWKYTYPSNPANGTYVWSRDEIVWAGDNSTTHSDAQLIGYIAVNGKDGVGMVVAYQQAASKPTNKPLVTSYETYKNTNDLLNNWVKAAPSGGSVLTSGGSVSGVRYNQNPSGGDWQSGVSDGGNTWYKSPEVGDNGIAKMQIHFTTSVDGQYVTFYIKAYSEKGFDFILVSEIDSTNVTRNSGYSTRASGNGVEESVKLKCDGAGSHFVTIAYAKDVSGKLDNYDYGLVRMATNENYVYVSTLLYRCDGDVNDGVISWGSIYQAQGEKGQKGDTGARGTKGALMREHDGFESGSYKYLSGAGEEAYVDVVCVEGNWYQCTTTYDNATSSPSLDDGHWTLMNNYKSIATYLLLAENATIKMLGSNQINLYNPSGGAMFGSFRVVDNDDDYAFWLGGETGAAAPFGVTRGGAIKATEGSIGSFVITNRKDKTGFAFYSLLASHDSTGVLPACDVEMDYRGFNVWSGNNESYNYTKASLGYNGASGSGTYNPAWFDGVLKITGNVTSGASNEVVAIYTNITPKSGYKSYALKAAQGDIWLENGNISLTKGDISLEQGAFQGALRPVVYTTGYGMTLTENNCCIICTNSSEITLTLPSSPQKGQMYMIYRANANVRVSSSKAIVSRGQDYPNGSTTWSTSYKNQLSIFVYDGSKWYVGFMNG